MSTPARLATRLVATLCLLLALVTAEAMASAGRIADLDRAYNSAATTLQANCVSLSEAVDRVRRQHGGRIISAETRRSGNRDVHHIKVLTPDNKVKTVRVNGCRR